MGNYNPHAPQILGQEWVGIRNEAVSLSPAINLVEVGHEFVLANSRQVSTGRFYVQNYAPAPVDGQIGMVTVYAAGTENQSGPVRRLLIPVNSAPATGTISSSLANTNAGRVNSVLSPGDGLFILVQPYATSGQKSVAFFFNTNAYAQALVGKRILALNLLYTLAWEPEESGTAVTAVKDVVYNPTQSLSLRAGSGSVLTFELAPFRDTYGNGLLYVPGIITGTLGDGSEVTPFGLGEMNPLSNTPPATSTTERWPWRYPELARFEETAGINRMWVQFDFGDTSAGGVYTGDISLGYLALEVLFCEEKRLLYGATKRSVLTEYVLGQNTVLMRDTSLNTNPILTPGAYTVALEMPDTGDLPGAVTTLGQKFAKDNAYPTFNGLRELYQIPSHPGRQINLTQTVDDTITVEQTLVLPQLSLHASGGDPLTEVHVFGTQARAQVYGAFTATQEILDSAANGARSYPWVRFYARRFGDTTVPLLLDSPTITGSGLSVQITPAEHDALDEIVDGWKEVTLRFTTAPTMGAGTNPQWRWSAAGELAGNRWEVLGVTAPALSGIPGNLFNKAPSAAQLPSATYGAPSAGSTINMGWMPQYAPPVSAPSDDTSTDAVLMFALDMPTVTGFSSSEQEQTVTGIGLDCGLNPCCIPSKIKYVRLTWGLPTNSGVANDTFTRTVAAGSWGSAETGGAYSYSGVVGDYSVNGSQGVVTFSFAGGFDFALLSVGAVNFDAQIDVSVDALPASSTVGGGIVGRYISANDCYIARISVPSTGIPLLRIEKYVGGVNTLLGEVTLSSMLLAAGSVVTVRFTVFGTFLKAKAWEQYTDEPDTWTIEVNDSSQTTGGLIGPVARNDTAAAGPVVRFDNFIVTPATYWFQYYEMQRMDAVETDWKTIMKATNVATTGFNDYEARVGVLSSYRIRAVDVYDFPGPWSSTVTRTLSSPGVTIGCTGGHLLIFTSNEQQDGSINLAYSSVWENQVEEGFAFPEAGFVELQAMYNRDFFTAFRPTERGGEQFARTVLVQAAAISTETLANFTGLRDMAWADVSYICVRDEDGNRWFATVLVPSGRVLRDRRLYMAPVEIIEVTDTPSEVDP